MSIYLTISGSLHLFIYAIFILGSGRGFRHQTPSIKPLAAWSLSPSLRRPPPYGPWVDGVYWSLVVEVSFYSFILLLIVVDQFRHLEIVAFFLAVYSLSLILVMLVDPAYIPSKYYYIGLGRYGVFFALGISIFLSKKRGMHWLVMATAALSIIGCILEIRHTAAPRSDVAFAWCVPASIWLAAVLIMAGGMHEWFKNLPSLKTAGLMTYSLYLVHDFIGGYVMRLAVLAGANRWQALAAAFLVAITLAWLITTRAEPAIRRGLNMAAQWIGSICRDAPLIKMLFQPSTPYLAQKA